MQFEHLPIIEKMMALYQKPLSMERFNEYLQLLHGDSKDLQFPVSGFNPMAKSHLLKKLGEMESLKAEHIMSETIENFNLRTEGLLNSKIKVALNILDDAQGGWTNRYTSDFDNRFKIGGYLNRNFSVVTFWSSEDYTRELIERRTIEAMRRSIYRVDKKFKPRSLKDHVLQEKFVSDFNVSEKHEVNEEVQAIKKFYESHFGSEEYHLIFNFFYGDEASASLNFPLYGLPGLGKSWKQTLLFL